MIQVGEVYVYPSLAIIFLHQDWIENPLKIDGLLDESLRYQNFHLFFYGLILFYVESPHLLPVRSKFWINIEVVAANLGVPCLRIF